MVKQKSLVTEDGHLNEEGVSLYVDALKLERTAELPRETRVHVAQCQECRKEVTGLFALLTDVDYKRAVPHPFFDDGAKQLRWTAREAIRVAAAVAAVAGSALLLYYLSSESTDSGPATAQRAESAARGDSSAVVDTAGRAEAKRGRELFAENFAELDDLEDLVTAVHRAGSIQSVSPGIGAAVGDTIVFQWTPETGGSVYLEILNNREEIYHAGDVLSLPYLVRKPETPGLYYWKLIGNEELVFVGKFLVKD